MKLNLSDTQTSVFYNQTSSLYCYNDPGEYTISSDSLFSPKSLYFTNNSGRASYGINYCKFINMIPTNNKILDSDDFIIQTTNNLIRNYSTYMNGFMNKTLAWFNIKSLYIPASKTEIEDGFLSAALNLKNIYYSPDCQITSIGEKAFFESPLIEFIDIPDTVKSIGASAYYNCWNTKGIALPHDLQTFGQDAMYCILSSSLYDPDKHYGAIKVIYPEFGSSQDLNSYKDKLPIYLTDQITFNEKRVEIQKIEPEMNSIIDDDSLWGKIDKNGKQNWGAYSGFTFCLSDMMKYPTAIDLREFDLIACSSPEEESNRWLFDNASYNAEGKVTNGYMDVQNKAGKFKLVGKSGEVWTYGKPYIIWTSSNHTEHFQLSSQFIVYPDEQISCYYYKNDNPYLFLACTNSSVEDSRLSGFIPTYPGDSHNRDLSVQNYIQKKNLVNTSFIRNIAGYTCNDTLLCTVSEYENNALKAPIPTLKMMFGASSDPGTGDPNPNYCGSSAIEITKKTSLKEIHSSETYTYSYIIPLLDAEEALNSIIGKISDAFDDFVNSYNTLRSIIEAIKTYSGYNLIKSLFDYISGEDLLGGVTDKIRDAINSYNNNDGLGTYEVQYEDGQIVFDGKNLLKASQNLTKYYQALARTIASFLTGPGLMDLIPGVTAIKDWLKSGCGYPWISSLVDDILGNGGETDSSKEASSNNPDDKDFYENLIDFAKSLYSIGSAFNDPSDILGDLNAVISTKQISHTGKITYKTEVTTTTVSHDHDPCWCVGTEWEIAGHNTYTVNTTTDTQDGAGGSIEIPAEGLDPESGNIGNASNWEDMANGTADTSTLNKYERKQYELINELKSKIGKTETETNPCSQCAAMSSDGTKTPQTED